MALFSITRYTGNDEVTAESTADKSQSEEILRLLHKDAEKRRQAKSDDKDVLPKKKKKKLKIDSDIGVDRTDTIKDETTGGITQPEQPMEEAALPQNEHSRSSLPATGDISGFTILGNVKPKKKQKVQRVLPAWLSNPSLVSSDIRVDQVPLRDVPGLDSQMVELLHKNGIEQFFPVQAQVIPALLQGGQPWLHLAGVTGFRPRDICCSAPTGSGKTLAYVVPVVQILKSRVVRRVRCLVVVPVGDLAAQVHKVFTDYCQDTDLRVGVVTGLKPFKQEQHALVKKGLRGYQSLVDIVVGTPGRLVDHINRTPGFDLSYLRFLVVDEADRMMEEIKQDWLTLVERAVYRERSAIDDQLYMNACQRSVPTMLNVENTSQMQIPLQKLLFSATFSQDPEKLNPLKLFQPLLFKSAVKSQPFGRNSTDDGADTVPPVPGAESLKSKNTKKTELAEDDFAGRYTTPVGLTEKFVECRLAQKPLMLLYILKKLQFKHVLCFTNSVQSTRTLYHLLNLLGDISVQEFSSRLHSTARSRILKKFAAGKVQILISTDAASRGIDVTDIDCVVSYDVPRVFTTYVHRVGRTARAGRPGTAFALLEKKEIFHFKKLLRAAGKTDVKELKVQFTSLKPYVEPVRSALKKLPAVLKSNSTNMSKR